MTATEIVKYQIDGVGGQINRSLKGLDQSALDYRVHENAFTIGEQINHLGEVYQSVITTSDGGKHEWGTFKLKGTKIDEMIAESNQLRSTAVEKILSGGDENLKLGTDFIVGHDNYHVGQLVTARLGLNPSWNSYEIYGE